MSVKDWPKWKIYGLGNHIGDAVWSERMAQHYYVVYHPEGVPYLSCICYNRSAAIRNFLSAGWDQNWKHYYRKGYRCRKVKLVEVR